MQGILAIPGGTYDVSVTGCSGITCRRLGADSIISLSSATTSLIPSPSAVPTTETKLSAFIGTLPFGVTDVIKVTVKT